MPEDSQETTYEFDSRIARRTILKAAGATAALGSVTGVGAAQPDGNGPGSGNGSSNPNDIDPIFGKAVAAGNPCAEDASEDCFEEFRPPVRPDHEVEMRIDIADLLFGLAEADVLTGEQIEDLKEAVADGSLDGDDLLDFDGVPFGEDPPLPPEEIAGAMIGSLGFNYDPAGLRVEPGDIVLYSAESPDHLVAAYHEGHGRQNRVPDEVGPISSPMPPVGGYWLYQFETEGVYDFYCSPHQTFGMVHRVVVTDDEEAPDLSIEEDYGTRRPPTEENALPSILGGLDPNIPSSREALDSEALEPGNIVDNESVSWETVVEEHRNR